MWSIFYIKVVFVLKWDPDAIVVIHQKSHAQIKWGRMLN